MSIDGAIATALVAAAGAVVGGLLTAVVGPFVKHRLDQSANLRKSREDQIARWRKMVVDVDRSTHGSIDPSEHLHVHPDYISLEPHLSQKARGIVTSKTLTVVLNGPELSYPLETLKNEIARIESEWGLRR